VTEAKERAAREGRSLSDVLGDAVRTSFARAAVDERKPVELPAFDSAPDEEHTPVAAP
jgi:hypothetical protein